MTSEYILLAFFKNYKINSNTTLFILIAQFNIKSTKGCLFFKILSSKRLIKFLLITQKCPIKFKHLIFSQEETKLNNVILSFKQCVWSFLTVRVGADCHTPVTRISVCVHRPVQVLQEVSLWAIWKNKNLTQQRHELNAFKPDVTVTWLETER